MHTSPIATVGAIAAANRHRAYARTRPALLGSLALLLAVACGGKATPATSAPAAAAAPPAPADVAAAGKAALEQYRQAYEVRSLDALAPLYVHTDELRIVNQGERWSGWDATRIELEALLSRTASIRLGITDAQVVALGADGAVVTASVARSVSDNVTTVDTKGVLTLVLRRDGERWVIVSEHSSHPPRL